MDDLSLLISNVSMVDINLIDSIAEIIDDETKVTPKHIIDLSRLIESFVLHQEIVIKDSIWVLDSGNNCFDYPFTEQWIKLFEHGGIIRDSENSAFNALTNIYPKYVTSQDLPEYGGDDYDDIMTEELFDEYLLKSSENNTLTWRVITNTLGIPFLSSDLDSEIKDSQRRTISQEMYRKMENYHKPFLEEMSELIGPTYVSMPTLLSLVLQECNSVADIPTVTMQIRDSLSEYVHTTTMLEYDLRTSKNIKDMRTILQDMKTCYEAITRQFSRTPQKRRIITRIISLMQAVIQVFRNPVDLIKSIKEWSDEEDAILLIPGYYDLWNASTEVEQARPTLERLFGNQIDIIFLRDLDAMNRHFCTPKKDIII